ncbi:hypothetical protein [Colwellia sp. MEBiC06753]
MKRNVKKSASLSALLSPLVMALASATLATTQFAYAQESEFDDWGDDWAETEVSPWSFSGFAEAARGQFLQNNVTQKQQSLSEFRVRADVDYSHELFEFSFAGDLYYDHVLEKSIWDTRELNIAFSPWQNLDVKVGRQVMTWGTGDYIFLNDTFPKDWQSFFAGRDDEFLKVPSDALRLSWYINNITFDFGYTPGFTSDHYLTGERFSFYSPFAGDVIAPEHFPVVNQDNETYSLRIKTTIDGRELAAYGYKGYWTSPMGATEQGLAYFPKLNTYGMSLRQTLFSGLFNMEFAKYNSIEDASGNLANIPNDQSRFLVGYEQEFIKNLTVGVQYYIEKTHDYDGYKQNLPETAPKVDEYRQMATLRLTHMAMQQKLVSSLFLFWSPTDQDGYVKPSVSFRYSDAWSFSVGGNFFFGDQDNSFWGQHQKNTNAWLRARFSY